MSRASDECSRPPRRRRIPLMIPLPAGRRCTYRSQLLHPPSPVPVSRARFRACALRSDAGDARTPVCVAVYRPARGRAGVRERPAARRFINIKLYMFTQTHTLDTQSHVRHDYSHTHVLQKQAVRGTQSPIDTYVPHESTTRQATTSTRRRASPTRRAICRSPAPQSRARPREVTGDAPFPAL